MESKKVPGWLIFYFLPRLGFRWQHFLECWCILPKTPPDQKQTTIFSLIIR